MKIKKISVKNVRSFKDETAFELLPDFNIFIGPNGSGKSNFLDILSVTLREYFIQIYSIQEVQYAPNQYQLTINSTIQNSDWSQKKYLEKYVDNESEDSEINIEFILQQEDIDNIHQIYDHRQRLLEVLDDRYNHHNTQYQYQYCLSRLQWVENWGVNLPLFLLNSTISYRIVNAELQTSELDEKARVFLEYMNIFELVSILLRDEKIFDLNMNFMSIGPYRGIDEGNQYATLSNSNQYELISKYMRSTSKDVTNLLAVGVLFFAQKRRKCESGESGYKKLWDQDPQVKSVSEFLEQINYTWDMQLLDPSKNIYGVVLQEGGRTIQLSQASSGERELLSFLLGIYAYRIVGGILIVDEPELHLHPKWQRVLLRIFKRLADETNNQFIVSTHAPAFINDESYRHIHRIYKHDNRSQHVYLEISEDISIRQIHHLINATNNEKIFFADGVVLVEGITDRLIFQKMLSMAQQKKNSRKVIEVVELKGKYNIECYKDFLSKLNIPYFIIADKDYLREVAPETLRAMMRPDAKKIRKDVLQNKSSIDGSNLVEKLDEAIRTEKLDDLRDLWEHIKTMRMDFKPTLTTIEEEQLNDFFAAQEKDNVHILREGAIEQYLPEQFRGKRLDKVLELLHDNANYTSWISSKLSAELRGIVDLIISKWTAKCQ